MFKTPKTANTWRGIEKAEKDINSLPNNTNTEDKIDFLKENIKHCSKNEITGYQRIINELERDNTNHERHN